MTEVILAGQTFTLGQKFMLEVPEVGVGNTGRNLIRKLLTEKTGKTKTLPKDWDWSPSRQVADEYGCRGRFTVRVSQYFKSYHNFTLSQEILTEVGNLASAHASKTTEYMADLVDDFTWRDGDFGDKDSCFWQGRSYARTMLRKNGALALRLFDTPDSGYGRAWVAREFPAEGVFTIFNGYMRNNHGENQTLEVTKLVAAHLKMAYLNMELKNEGSHQGTLYVNGAGGYAIGVEERIESLRNRWGAGIVDLRWRDDSVKCRHCEGRVAPEDLISVEGRTQNDMISVCPNCAQTRTQPCSVCSRRVLDRFTHTLVRCDSNGRYHDEIIVCDACTHNPEVARTCSMCGTTNLLHWLSEMQFNGKHIHVCELCVATRVTTCTVCNTQYDKQRSTHARTANTHCPNCAQEAERQRLLAIQLEREQAQRQKEEQRRELWTTWKGRLDEFRANGKAVAIPGATFRRAGVTQYLDEAGTVYTLDADGTLLAYAIRQNGGPVVGGDLLNHSTLGLRDAEQTDRRDVANTVSMFRQLKALLESAQATVQYEDDEIPF